MVSFESPFFPQDQRNNLISVFEDSSSSSSSADKKRKRVVDDDHTAEGNGILHDHDHDYDHNQRKNPKSFSDLGLHLETPLPSEWQRFLDIQSGEIHFYNTRTHKRTLKDPRETDQEDIVVVVKEEPVSGRGHMSLDLDLNLPCGPLTSSAEKESNNKNHIRKKQDSNTRSRTNSGIFFMKDFGDKERSTSLSLSSTSSPSSLEADDQQQQEMVATVCTRCHMLVMLFKSSPSCPNCKFMHPPDHTPPTLFKPKLSLLCSHN